MSWSVQAIGKAEAVRTNIAQQFDKAGACAEPEESIRQAAKVLIDKAIEAQSGAVKVVACGSQSFKDWNAKTGVTNAMSITIEPQYGFLE